MKKKITLEEKWPWYATVKILGKFDDSGTLTVLTGKQVNILKLNLAVI